MTRYPFEVSADGTVTVSRNDYLTTFFTGLRRRDIEIMVQLEGAPKQWPSRVKPERPHLFRCPTDLTGAAHAIGKWAKLYSGFPISWCMWNEPSHNLIGKADRTSIHEMVDIYDAYTGAIAPQGFFGMASFVPSNADVSQDLGGQTYLGATIDELRQRLKTKPGLPFHYPYHEQLRRGRHQTLRGCAQRAGHRLQHGSPHPGAVRGVRTPPVGAQRRDRTGGSQVHDVPADRAAGPRPSDLHLQRLDQPPDRLPQRHRAAIDVVHR